MPDEPLDLTPDDETDAHAGELALGVLDGDAYRSARRRVEDDPAFAAAVAAWELRLAGLTEAIPPAAPSADWWPAIARSLPGYMTETRPWWDSLGVWRAATAAASAAAVVLAIVAVQPPREPPANTAQTVLASAPLRTENGRVLFVITFDEASRRVVATPVGADGQPGHSHELWVIPKDGSPVSLGLMPVDNAASMSVSVPLSPDAVLAISVEPMGGSPTGLPTGPVVAQGRLSPL